MEKDRRMILCSIIGTIRTPTALFQTPSSTQNVLLERAGHRFLCRDHLMPCVKGSHSESISAGHCLIGEADCGRCFLKGFCQARVIAGKEPTTLHMQWYSRCLKEYASHSADF